MAPPTPLAAQMLARVTDAFEAARDDEAAPAMRSYLRDQFPFLGIKTPTRVTLLRTALADLPRPDADDVDAFARACWARPEREYQYAGMTVVRKHVGGLPATFLDTLHVLITTKSWWDTVDDLAANSVGPLVRAHGLQRVMDDWIDDPNIWLARSALLHQMRAKAATDTDRLFAYCLRRSGDTEFFIRKAIGWALREHSKTDPAAVRAFVAAHDEELSGLSKREALKWLDRRAARGVT